MSARVPPHNLEAEAVVLGAALLEPEKVLDEPWAQLPADAFYREGHREIYAALRELWNETARVDEIAVAERLERQGKLERAGGLSYLANLRANAPAAYYAQGSAEILRAKWQYRRIIEVAGDVLRRAFDESDEPGDLAYHADHELLGIVESRSAEPVSIAEAAAAALQKYKDVAAGLRPQPITLGVLARLDATLMLEPGDMMQVLASTGVGKSLFALQAAESVARRGIPALYYSLEMPAEQKGERVLVQKTGLDMARLRMGGITPQEESMMHHIIANLAGVPLYVQDSLETEAQIISDIRRQVRNRGVRLVVVDYLGLIESSGEEEKRYLALAKTARRLKRLAMRLGVVVLLLHQLNREAEGVRPDLSNSADGYGITRDADVVGMLYRVKDEMHGGYMPQGEFLLRKGRNVRTGSYPFRYNPQTMRFSDA